MPAKPSRTSHRDPPPPGDDHADVPRWRALGEILEALRQMDREQSSLFVERVGTPRQKVLTDFAEIARQSPDYLSLMIVRRPCSS